MGGIWSDMSKDDAKIKHQALLEVWYKARDEQKLRVKYPLNKNSVVFDVGAFHGVWAKQMYDLYGCTVYCFEPVPTTFKGLQKVESEYIKCYQFGIGDSDRVQHIEFEKDASSFFTQSNKNRVLVYVRTMDFVLNTLGIEGVDLIKSNIEGSEYEMFEYMIERNMLDKFEHIQIQFHRNVPDFENRRKNIREALSKTHNCTYNYEFIWESWSRK
jgi:FkbM family methyltransferase